MNKPKMRFPDSMLAMVQHDPEPMDSSPREHAIALGANKAHQWINSLYGSGTAPSLDLGFELPTRKGSLLGLRGGWHKPTKAEFAMLLEQATQALETQYQFDRSDGTHQVRLKSQPTQEAYGFWDALHNISEEFDLWTVLFEPPKKGWAPIKLQQCDLCSNAAQWAHPKGGFRCDTCCPRP
jgi:hypothetical protein